jgi:hypothetical protein
MKSATSYSVAARADGIGDEGVRWNKNQYFGGVLKAIWEFKIGGYQVCEKHSTIRKSS